MKYKFFIQKISKSIIYSIGIDDNKLLVLSLFTDVGWTPQKVQEIIDGVLNAKNGKGEYRWANEDLFLVARSEAVGFFDLISGRVGVKSEKQDLTLSHEDFITFLKDFKEFVQEN